MIFFTSKAIILSTAMTRFILFLSALCLLFSRSNGQLVVYQDATGQILTNFEIYNPTGSATTALHRVDTYLGSPFLNFPVWQKGTVQLDKRGQEIIGELAYNLVSNDVLFRIPGDSTVKTIVPQLFTINGDQFVRQQTSGADRRLYTTVLYNGRTKLLTSLTKRLDAYSASNSRETSVIGSYKTLNNYYIQKGKAKPEIIALTKNSLLTVLYEQADKIVVRLPARKLTLGDVATTLRYYDSLMVLDQTNKLPLTKESMFTQILHDKINYPDYARSQGVYGRVYAGFEIDEQGQIKNIAILSPDNGGFRFDVVVRNALEKLPGVNPTLRGKYALPVAFTYTNTKEKSAPYSPVNYLSPDRLEGRTLLEEFVVSAVVTKPIIATREVWGYYK